MESTAGVSSELDPSTQIVESNDDLLTEILLRLPVVSLHVFKSVSKRWCTLITNPDFALRRSQNPRFDSASGLILQRRKVSEYDFLPLDTRIPVPLPTAFSFNSSKVEILQSCNGLLLCHLISLDKFIVYNPSMNRFKTIPESPYQELRYGYGGFRMAFDPSKSSHYKIVCAGVIENNDGSHLLIEIQVYSSKTCEWSVLCHRRNYHVFKGFTNGLYWNDAIHWLHTNYNTNCHSMLDIAEHSIKTRARKLLPDLGNGDHKLFESRGCLLVICSQNYPQHLNIYEMIKWDSGWSMKYIVYLSEIMTPFPNTWSKSSKWFCSRARCIVIGDNDEDSFLVMEMCGNIVRYSIGLRTLLKIYELDSVIDSPDSFQFIASLAAV
ncbi:F-box protein At5g07610-like [Bidens hawaiensis]|uniref:F-box protein At5g07610-like n=1 Tax=Bidens hawaiensis TaxID=980011 RepID=UPI00404A20F2